MFGVQVLLVWADLDGSWLGLIWTHLMFVLPYVFLTLADPYRSLDPRYARSALALGRSPFAVWTRIKLVMLLRPLLIALAVGFAVSVAQYVPTLFAGGGRFSTLTTEALTLAAGGDRRVDRPVRPDPRAAAVARLRPRPRGAGLALPPPPGDARGRVTCRAWRSLELTLSVGGRTLVSDLDLRVGPGEVTTLMGPSGCGKSSLLAYLCGTLEPAFAAAGEVRLDGVAIEGLPPEQRRIGILFQDDLLFPHLSVGENLAFALPAAVRGRQERWARVEAALDEADLAGFARRDPATLSGGQRARIALMRTLLALPRALLLDEPFAKLDIELRERVRRFVFEHARRAGLPTLLVTHDPADAQSAGGVVVAFPQRTAVATAANLLPLRNSGRQQA